MKMFVGVADAQMIALQREKRFDEINYWMPSTAAFRALEPGEMFLFKLHAPEDKIVGGGYFVRYAELPMDLAWHIFGQKNGLRTYAAFSDKILKYRRKNLISEENPQIGCIVLTEPFFFAEEEWIPAPKDWSRYIVRGKGYSTEDEIGRELYAQVTERLSKRTEEGVTLPDEEHLLAQGAFRVSVIEAYQKRCAITGERTIPVLDVAHIKPLAKGGPNTVNNGILLRSDLRTLFLNGYLTIDKDFAVQISKRLSQDYGGGASYQELQGKSLVQLPENIVELPAREFLEWHRKHVFLG
ncbi:MAG: HNH endonuclease [Lachnospiraceae bacterium]|nr:HNH endonuclease [Lachnospiraceae bacterium]